MEAACMEMNNEEALEQCPAEMTDTKYKKKRRLGSSIINVALSDTDFHIVLTVKANPVEMLEKLDARYESKTAASKIIKITD